MKWFSKSQQSMREKQLENIYTMLEGSGDYISKKHQLKKTAIYCSFIRTIVDTDMLQRDILTPLIQQSEGTTLEELRTSLPFEEVILTDDVNTIKEKVLQGHVLIQLEKNSEQGLLLDVKAKNDRQVSPPEVEYNVLGPNESFIESLDVNIYLLRKRLPLPNFKIKEVTVGKLTKTRTAIIYIDGLANEENVNTVMQRVTAIEYDQIIDVSFISQMIEDDHNSAFPQLVDTERPDRVASSLSEGKIAILVDGSPFALMGPTTIVEFFSAFDDYTLNWYIASAFRLIRLMSVAFSVLATPLYVATLTFHYQLIPKNLLATLISSRMGIPFPPLAEAFLMEFTIEVLREAGVRLPTKVGQTIGIVGGIVIGTASVQANLTSNVLLILVAMAALASFTTPNYRMNNTVRLIRFPFLLFAGLWGMYGIACCFAIVVAHLLRLESLGRPYIEPFFPLRIKDLKDAFFRLPFSKQKLRPMLLRPQDPGRVNTQRASKKHDIDD
ncbi:spore germination protein [Pullulanibacillus camelliae]|uniref:Spore germination protein n=1 Tax=Pullulanibacillus camelliae TaxID=1707096 RepID=A0A8J2VJK3_9BACL|nr:spore germination protein [Pullulanibacillus camelliae]GGE32224.1 spore germination protein [Pullulanibacillus camelliae]